MLKQPLLGASFVLVANQILNEFKQFRSEAKKINYFCSFWNVIDVTYLTLNFLLLCNSLVNWIPLEYSHRMAAVTSICLLMKFFDWLRLFE